MLSTASATRRLRAKLETLYARYNRRGAVHLDPIAAVHRFEDPRDQEIVGLIASSLAFGNVKQIVGSVDRVLCVFPQPRNDLLTTSPAELRRRVKDFRHRYVTGVELADLLLGVQGVVRKHTTLGHCFAQSLSASDETVLPALTRFVHELRADSTLAQNYLLPDPSRGSACKRLLLYLRWMVRHDEVDTGAWAGVSPHLTPEKLVAPIDTHMHRISQRLGWTQRKTPDLRTALEVTDVLRRISPKDPIRYDFALTHLGIQGGKELTTFLQAFPET